MRKPDRLHNLGFSMIELTVATAIYSIGLSGISIMMLAAVGGTNGAQHQTTAVTQAGSLAEMIAMNPAAVGHYINPLAANEDSCVAGRCSPDEMAALNMNFWQTQVQRELPAGEGLVCRDSTADDGNALDPSCDGNGGLVIKVFWQDNRHRQDEGDGVRRFVSRLPW